MTDDNGKEHSGAGAHADDDTSPHWWDTPVDRRRFLKLMGASLALAGTTGCEVRPARKIVPYVETPEASAHNDALRFATAITLGGYAAGIIAKSIDGRPIKIDGNPRHPASLGASSVFAQAEILSLYDPERAQAITHLDRPSDWPRLHTDLQAALDKLAPSGGEGLRILTGNVTSPTLAAQLRSVLGRYRHAQWHQYEPLAANGGLAGSRLAFGIPVSTRFDFTQAQCVLSLDADFLNCGPAHLRYAHDFMQRRRSRESNRLYVLESAPTNTSAMADHRLARPAGAIDLYARAIAAAVGLPAATWKLEGADARWVTQVARELSQSRGRSLVIAGDAQPGAVHAIAHALNATLGNIGRTVFYSDPVEASPVDHIESISALAADMHAGAVRLLIILDANPVLTAPADLAFADALARVPFTLVLSNYRDETGHKTLWHLPARHFLESWSDARAFDGTATIVQPLIAPLHPSWSAHMLMATLLPPGRTTNDYAIVRGFWHQRRGHDFDSYWHEALWSGVVPDSALPARRLQPRADLLERLPPASRPEGLEVRFVPDAGVWDGRFANNAWLQEFPKPLTRLTWDNAALISPATAARLGIETGDIIELSVDNRGLQAPAWLLPGQADDSIALPLGYGRSAAGGVGNNVGFNAYPLVTRDNPAFTSGVDVRKTGIRHQFAPTQHHSNMEGRDPVRVVRQGVPDPSLPDIDDPPSLYPGYNYEGYKWAMLIDLTSCIGCGACVVACQAENNIPVVGKHEVTRGRAMHWLRIDRYYAGDAANPQTLFQPIPCMHCEQAPCEYVCPVAASVHDSEGLNLQVYNRCVGTRYCSNNCPYKVRRFNWFQYNDLKSEHLKAVRNPDVTVRSRGVMEKCTYCIQRISGARIEAEKQDRRIADGEVTTACQDVCPTRAIVFGDLNDQNSNLVARRASPLHYALLRELGTRPRTTYLARVINPGASTDGSGRDDESA